MFGVYDGGNVAVTNIIYIYIYIYIYKYYRCHNGSQCRGCVICSCGPR